MSAPSTHLTPTRGDYDVAAVRAEFPVLQRKVYDRPLVYLDNAATSQTPQCVVDAIDHFYQKQKSNVHRGIHRLSQEATEAYEAVRGKIQALINAPEPETILYTSGTTAGVNLVASSYGGHVLKPGDEILVSEMEHHSNIVPWQLIAQRTGATVRVLPMDATGTLVMSELDRALEGPVKIVAVNHVSNALGTINPVSEICARAHAAGAVVLVDGAQAVPHRRVDVQELGADFYVFSAHKAFGPTGSGALWGRRELLEAMPPWQGGGDMIRSVSFDGSTWNRLPYKFEAGTPNVADVIGFGRAIDWLTSQDLDRAFAWEDHLLERATERVGAIEGLRIIGTANDKVAVLSFVVEGTHPHDLGTILDRDGIAIRTGHHCAQPALRRFELSATARASFALYNTEAEVDAFADSLERACRLFG